MNDAINPKVVAEKARGTYRKTARRKTTRKVGTGKAHRTDRKTASKVVAEKARGRKTARKVGTGTAHRTDRKSASKVVAEKARGPYRKTAARYEEFAYDAQLPESMRALAEKSVAQTREFYVHSLEALLESWERFVVAAGQGTVALNRKAIDITRHNINTGSIPVSVLRRGWQGRKTLPSPWNCKLPIGASSSANWQPEKCAR